MGQYMPSGLYLKSSLVLYCLMRPYWGSRHCERGRDLSAGIPKGLGNSSTSTLCVPLIRLSSAAQTSWHFPTYLGNHMIPSRLQGQVHRPDHQASQRLQKLAKPHVSEMKLWRPGTPLGFGVRDGNGCHGEEHILRMVLSMLPRR